MTKKIVIQSCEGCPHKDHNGAFGSPAYVPICGKTGKPLPYGERVSGGRCYAYPTYVIPEWCPLEDD